MITGCPKCRRRMFDDAAFDEHGDHDPHCAGCGYRPIVNIEDLDERDSEGNVRRRKPSHGRVRL